MIRISADQSIPIYRRVADAVRAGVRSGEIEPGTKLPSKTSLAETTGASLVTVGKAYDLLQRWGIVEQRQGSGTYVLPDAQERVRDSYGRHFSTLAIVIGRDRLTDCSRDRTFVIADILEGVMQGLGDHPIPVRYKADLSVESLSDLPNDSAVLLMRSTRYDQQAIGMLADRGIPLLGVWGDELHIPVPRVDYDHHQAASLACRHLIDCGYQRLGFIGSMGDRHPLGAKFFEFTNVLYNANLDFQVRHVRNASAQPGHAFGAALSIMEGGDMPDAFFVDTDYKAMEVIAALQTAGLKVPGDVGVASHGDIPESARFHPPLTTVRIPRREIGRCAAELLLGWATSGTPLKNVTLHAELIVRESTASAASGDSAARTASTSTGNSQG